MTIEIEVPNRTFTSEVFLPSFGSKEHYLVEFDNGLVEEGGIVTINCEPITGTRVEGYKEVALPYTTILSVQATAHNFVGDANTLTGESAFARITDTGIVVYATAESSSAREMQVMWTIKGVK